jgi:hypothetical protein
MAQRYSQLIRFVYGLMLNANEFESPPQGVKFPDTNVFGL